MIDIITYVANSDILKTELQNKFPELLSDDGEFLVNKTPTIRNAAGETLALVRGDETLIAIGEQLDSLVLLGTYEDVFNTLELKEIYDRIYDQTPKTFIDAEGIEQTYTPPAKFGVFA